MSILIDPSKVLVSIEILYIEEQKRHGNTVFYFVRSQEELEEWQNKGYDFNNSDKEKEIKRLRTVWKRLNWKDNNQIISRSMVQSITPTGQVNSRLDPIAYSDQKLKTCLKKWDLKDDQGNDVEINNDIIDSIAPEFAQEMLSAFERVTEMTSTDLKK